MLLKNLKTISPSLAEYINKIAPELADEQVSLYKPKGIPKSRRFVGRSYLFSYRNPQGKGSKSLPYYHFCPMVIMLEQTTDYMMGLNPFYLRPDQREELMSALLAGLTGEPDDQETRARITYKMIAKYRRRYRTAFPCIKRYSHARMGTVVMELKPELWNDFYLGEVSKRHQTLFIGKSAPSIWNESFAQVKQYASRKKN